MTDRTRRLTNIRTYLLISLTLTTTILMTACASAPAPTPSEETPIPGAGAPAEIPTETARVTQPLRDEHQELLPRIQMLRSVADSIGEASIESPRKDVDYVYEFLTNDLIPHAKAEDRALYPVVGRFMGTPEATATMSRDHEEVARLTQELASLRSGLTGSTLGSVQARELRRVLYGLYALITVHFAKEEEIYLPLLDAHLTPDAADQMFEAMEEAEREAKQG